MNNTLQPALRQPLVSGCFTSVRFPSVSSRAEMLFPIYATKKWMNGKRCLKKVQVMFLSPTDVFEVTDEWMRHNDNSGSLYSAFLKKEIELSDYETFAKAYSRFITNLKAELKNVIEVWEWNVFFGSNFNCICSNGQAVSLDKSDISISKYSARPEADKIGQGMYQWKQVEPSVAAEWLQKSMDKFSEHIKCPKRLSKSSR